MASIACLRSGLLRCLLGAMVGLAGCAEVSPPPGGEVDQNSPYLISSEPADGALNVEPGTKIILQFSERVAEPGSGKAVFISPRPVAEPKLRWKGSRVEISLADTFQTNATYVVSVSTDIADLRGNKLDSGGIVAFSTGPSIDSGVVGGAVYRKDRRAAAIMVGLYRENLFEDTTVPIDSIYPDYLTQSNQEGRFRFQHLPEREYRLIAFEDKNRTERFEPFREAFALPDRHLRVGPDTLLKNLRLHLTTQDTATVEILSASFTSENLLKMRLSRSISLKLLRDRPANIFITAHDEGTRAMAAGIVETDLDSSHAISSYFGQLQAGSYDVELTYDGSLPAVLYEGIEYAPVQDKTAPRIIRFYPEGGPKFADEVEIMLVFSEPLDTSAFSEATFVLQTEDGTAVPLVRKWQDVFHCRFKPESWREGERYSFAVTEFEIADMAGNILGDSLTTYRFSVLDSDSLGAIAGEVVIEVPGGRDSPVVLEFQQAGSREVYDLTVAMGGFSVDLPAGKYLLSGFIDSNRDGKKDNGSIVPFRLAETFAAFPDTVSVRARFETSGIRFEFR